MWVVVNSLFNVIRVFVLICLGLCGVGRRFRIFRIGGFWVFFFSVYYGVSLEFWSVWLEARSICLTLEA